MSKRERRRRRCSEQASGDEERLGKCLEDHVLRNKLPERKVKEKKRDETQLELKQTRQPRDRLHSFFIVLAP